jgi:hypothetical protein
MTARLRLIGAAPYGKSYQDVRADIFPQVATLSILDLIWRAAAGGTRTP